MKAEVLRTFLYRSAKPLFQESCSVKSSRPWDEKTGHLSGTSPAIQIEDLMRAFPLEEASVDNRESFNNKGTTGQTKHMLSHNPTNANRQNFWGMP